jgi:hypothetical protein
LQLASNGADRELALAIPEFNRIRSTRLVRSIWMSIPKYVLLTIDVAKQLDGPFGLQLASNHFTFSAGP